MYRFSVRDILIQLATTLTLFTMTHLSHGWCRGGEKNENILTRSVTPGQGSDKQNCSTELHCSGVGCFAVSSADVPTRVAAAAASAAAAAASAAAAPVLVAAAAAAPLAPVVVAAAAAADHHVSALAAAGALVAAAVAAEE